MQLDIQFSTILYFSSYFIRFCLS